MYSALKPYLVKKFGKKLGKIGLSTNVPCPNNPACTFCNASSFIPHSIKFKKISIKQQINDALPYLQKKYKTDSFIAYFQDNTSTFGNLDILSKMFSEATAREEIKVLAISTRPDYIYKNVMDAIIENSHGKPIWIELGLQSIHNTTLKQINRGHTYEDFLAAFALIRQYKDIEIGVHLILGLPNENLDMQLDTCRAINEISPDYIKFHHLQVLKNTAIVKDFEKGFYIPLELNEYINILVNCLSLIDKKIIIQRILSDAHINELIAPRWNISKQLFKTKLFEYMDSNGIVQGCNIIKK